jgi:N-acyl-D-aspartate/D-glutamate deacylase
VWATHLLGHWVREVGALTLEQGVWRITGHPAQVYRLRGRGRIAPGYAADLVAFDPDTIGYEPAERVHDLPAGAERLVARSRGIHATWVNGTSAFESGKDLNLVRSGRVLR